MLSEEFGDDIDVVLVDQSDAFVFGFSKLDVMFGRAQASAVQHPYRDIVKLGVRFDQSTVRSIDPVAKHVVTDAASFDANILVVALGADVRPAETPGLLEGGTSSTQSRARSRSAMCWPVSPAAEWLLASPRHRSNAHLRQAKPRC